MITNYTAQCTELEDGTIAVRISETFYRTPDADPITEHHRGILVPPGESITSDQIIANLRPVRSEWVRNMIANGDHTRMADMVNAIAAVASTPDRVSTFQAKLAQEAAAVPAV